MSDAVLPIDDAHLRETCIDERQVFEGKFLDVRQHRVRLPDGRETGREFIVHPGAVMIVPLLSDGRLVVERQFRYPLRRAFIEFPAGKLDPGESPLTCAVRELAEETGYRATEWARAGILHNAIAYSTEGIEVWFARGLVAGEPQLDAGEFLDVFTLTLDELEALAESGELTDAKTLIGMLWITHWRAGKWKLDWQPAPDSPAGA
ncbi:MAG: NUDIX hydrolase [Methylibium sp.]|uniref:NUDIX domain-containing protein n=1 Tax=Methylibium sp. TaxID=2067992 RepID=UPI00183C17F4|nr:NUDIX hydrolase [Methylibium sp.]MBA2723882.1 NUDIX hydrolase [Methylibium sp.]MBA3590844.1 NUDIX hydrolase [Methylibium sp.]MBA3623141.1 NUDIX hydrolase [Methylibium sp.]